MLEYQTFLKAALEQGTRVEVERMSSAGTTDEQRRFCLAANQMYVECAGIEPTTLKTLAAAAKAVQEAASTSDADYPEKAGRDFGCSWVVFCVAAWQELNGQLPIAPVMPIVRDIVGKIIIMTESQERLKKSCSASA